MEEENSEFEEEIRISEESEDTFDGPQRSHTMPNISTMTFIEVPSTLFENEKSESPISSTNHVENCSNKSASEVENHVFKRNPETMKATVNARSKRKKLPISFFNTYVPNPASFCSFQSFSRNNDIYSTIDYTMDRA